MKYILDTSAYSELLRGHKKVAAIVTKSNEILIPHVVIAELKYGFRLGTKQFENERLLNRFVASKKVRIILPDNATADYFVDIAVYARKKRIQLSSHDIWIAAFTQQYDASLVTFDNDFTHLNHEGLRIALL
jgi:predicted nucleic acid-binding protein